MEKRSYIVRIERIGAQDVMIDNDTNEILTGRVTLAGMVLAGVQRPADGKLLMVFQELA